MHYWLTSAYMFDIGHQCYGQLTAAQNKVHIDQYHMTISRAHVYDPSRSRFLILKLSAQIVSSAEVFSLIVSCI